ncbi:unnamed protein product, partial [Nesidiocoris tenuis]
MNGQADYAEVDTRGLSTFMNGRRDQPTPYATTTLLNRRPVPCQQDGCVSPGSNRRCPPPLPPSRNYWIDSNNSIASEPINRAKHYPPPNQRPPP